MTKYSALYWTIIAINCDVVVARLFARNNITLMMAAVWSIIIVFILLNQVDFTQLVGKYEPQ